MLTNLEEIEQRVMINCLIVQQVVEDWAYFSGGLYPDDTGLDTDPAGKTLVSYLPDKRLLENPVWLVCTEPVDGSACNWGQTWYEPIVDGGVNAGYQITGVGAFLYTDEHGRFFTICEIVNTGGTITVTTRSAADEYSLETLLLEKLHWP